MKTTSAPDLTMLAMAAYDAIRKDMEDTHEKKTHIEGEPGQRGDRLRDRRPGGHSTLAQCDGVPAPGCRLIAI